MEEKKEGRKWTEEQKEAARERAIFDCHLDLLVKIPKSPEVLSVIEDPVKFQKLKEMARRG